MVSKGIQERRSGTKESHDQCPTSHAGTVWACRNFPFLWWHSTRADQSKLWQLSLSPETSGTSSSTSSIHIFFALISLSHLVQIKWEGYILLHSQPWWKKCHCIQFIQNSHLLLFFFLNSLYFIFRKLHSILHEEKAFSSILIVFLWGELLETMSPKFCPFCDACQHLLHVHYFNYFSIFYLVWLELKESEGTSKSSSGLTPQSNNACSFCTELLIKGKSSWTAFILPTQAMVWQDQG